MLVFSVTDLASFESLPSLVGPRQEPASAAVAQPGEGGEFECCLVANKADEELQEAEGSTLCQSARRAYIETSALNKAFVDLDTGHHEKQTAASRRPLPDCCGQNSDSKKAQQRLQSSAELLLMKLKALVSRRRRKLACVLLLRRYLPRRIELRKRDRGTPRSRHHCVGCIVGSGIFVSPKGILQESKSVGLSFIMWAVTGIFQCTGAVCYSAELGTTHSRSGRVHLRTAGHGALPAFLVLWITFVAIGAVSNAANSLLFAKYCLVT
uniref:Large neutral amino acids transporter small subunit 2 n=1 Tax=Macrostomum lignano TaxID=282301 RepID=A0A1I8JNV4_9PLAT